MDSRIWGWNHPQRYICHEGREYQCLGRANNKH
uniref:Uncharacterized protein n=1 Tax=Arundo donax TaxID=35708 RepID=A0A0A9FKX0_ARUDO